MPRRQNLMLLFLADSYHFSSAGGQAILKAMTDDASVSAGMKAAVLAVHN